MLWLRFLVFRMRNAREEFMGTESPYLMLDQLAMQPDHPDGGAAKLMLYWELRKEDQEGLVINLDATSVGRPMNEKRRFKLVGVVERDRVP
ncbi:hypothetical protein BDW02DRAFT_566284 [Decorospora gaudefroyi]|uniref:Uncharacterized protein n=1 Tax=Decorospora gaudefroyi TaxID=184978 RepID=A0A6A5KS29_9PLEO|nr:hypothetical protein BDW02DRAFT_566284 [Decorospora gaudefroyi]